MMLLVKTLIIKLINGIDVFKKVKLYFCVIFFNQNFRGGFREAGGGGGGGGGARAPPPPPPARAPPFFCNHLFFLEITLKNCKLFFSIINNVPLTYVYPSTVETCLTPNYLLFGRQSLYSCNTTSTTVRNLTVLSSTVDKINRISNHFLDRWRH